LRDNLSTGRSREAADAAAHGYIELVPEKEVLGFKPTSRPEQVSDKRGKQL
jgi:hypothetical protein